MALEDRKIWAEARRDLPAVITEGTPGALRGGRRGELMVEGLTGGKTHALSNEGSYFSITNGTVGTGVAGIAASDGFDDLETYIFLRNTEPNSTGKRFFLDYLLLRPTAAGTNGTNFSFAMKMDRGATRLASGGTAFTPINMNMDSAAASIVSANVGAGVTTAATTDARLVTSGLIRSSIKVIGDTYLFTFGQTAHTSGQQAATITNFVIPCPPVVVGPGQMFLFHEFAASQTVAASYTFQMGWWER